MDKSKLALGPWKDRLNDDQILVLYALRRNGYRFLAMDHDGLGGVAAFKRHPKKHFMEDGAYYWTDEKCGWMGITDGITPGRCAYREAWERDNRRKLMCGYEISPETGFGVEEIGTWKEEWFKDHEIIRISEIILGRVIDV